MLPSDELAAFAGAGGAALLVGTGIAVAAVCIQLSVMYYGSGFLPWLHICSPLLHGCFGFLLTQ